MAITNLNNHHLTTAEVTAANDAVNALETALASINVNIAAADRHKYGSINEQNKLFVNKVQDYHLGNPQLQSAQVDWIEYEKDHASRQVMEKLLAKLDALTTKIKGAKILHDYDNYQAALVDYAYTSYMAGTGADGFETKHNDLKQFFAKNTNKVAPDQ